MAKGCTESSARGVKDSGIALRFSRDPEQIPPNTRYEIVIVEFLKSEGAGFYGESNRLPLSSSD